MSTDRIGHHNRTDVNQQLQIYYRHLLLALPEATLAIRKYDFLNQEELAKINRVSTILSEFYIFWKKESINQPVHPPLPTLAPTLTQLLDLFCFLIYLIYDNYPEKRSIAKHKDPQRSYYLNQAHTAFLMVYSQILWYSLQLTSALLHYGIGILSPSPGTVNDGDELTVYLDLKLPRDLSCVDIFLFYTSKLVTILSAYTDLIIDGFWKLEDATIYQFHKSTLQLLLKLFIMQSKFNSTSLVCAGQVGQAVAYLPMRHWCYDTSRFAAYATDSIIPTPAMNQSLYLLGLCSYNNITPVPPPPPILDPNTPQIIQPSQAVAFYHQSLAPQMYFPQVLLPRKGMKASLPIERTPIFKLFDALSLATIHSPTNEYQTWTAETLHTTTLFLSLIANWIHAVIGSQTFVIDPIDVFNLWAKHLLNIHYSILYLDDIDTTHYIDNEENIKIFLQTVINYTQAMMNYITWHHQYYAFKHNDILGVSTANPAAKNALGKTHEDVKKGGRPTMALQTSPFGPSSAIHAHEAKLAESGSKKDTDHESTNTISNTANDDEQQAPAPRQRQKPGPKPRGGRKPDPPPVVPTTTTTTTTTTTAPMDDISDEEIPSRKKVTKRRNWRNDNTESSDSDSDKDQHSSSSHLEYGDHRSEVRISITSKRVPTNDSIQAQYVSNLDLYNNYFEIHDRWSVGANTQENRQLYQLYFRAIKNLFPFPELFKMYLNLWGRVESKLDDYKHKDFHDYIILPIYLFLHHTKYRPYDGFDRCSASSQITGDRFYPKALAGDGRGKKNKITQQQKEQQKEQQRERDDDGNPNERERERDRAYNKAKRSDVAASDSTIPHLIDMSVDWLNEVEVDYLNKDDVKITARIPLRRSLDKAGVQNQQDYDTFVDKMSSTHVMWEWQHRQSKEEVLDKWMQYSLSYFQKLIDDLPYPSFRELVFKEDNDDDDNLIDNFDENVFRYGQKLPSHHKTNTNATNTTNTTTVKATTTSTTGESKTDKDGEIGTDRDEDDGNVSRSSGRGGARRTGTTAAKTGRGGRKVTTKETTTDETTTTTTTTTTGRRGATSRRGGGRPRGGRGGNRRKFMDDDEDDENSDFENSTRTTDLTNNNNDDSDHEASNEDDGSQSDDAPVTTKKRRPGRPIVSNDTTSTPTTTTTQSTKMGESDNDDNNNTNNNDTTNNTPQNTSSMFLTEQMLPPTPTTTPNGSMNIKDNNNDGSDNESNKKPTGKRPGRPPSTSKRSSRTTSVQQMNDDNEIDSIPNHSSNNSSSFVPRRGSINNSMRDSDNE